MRRRLIVAAAVLLPVLALALPVRRLREMIAVAASGVSVYRNPELLLEFEDDDFSTGGTVHDTSGNDYHLGVVVGGMGEGTRGSRKSAIFYGTNEVRRAVSDWNSGATNGTISMWVYPVGDVLNAYYTLFSSADEASTSHYIAIMLRGGAANRYFQIATRKAGTLSWVRSADGTVPPNEWTMITAQSSGTAWKLWVNGSPAAVTLVIGSNNGDCFSDIANRDSLTLGYMKRSVEDTYFTGRLSDIYITNEVLTEDEILDLYNRTK